jgi:hypothetical protein
MSKLIRFVLLSKGRRPNANPGGALLRLVAELPAIYVADERHGFGERSNPPTGVGVLLPDALGDVPVALRDARVARLGPDQGLKLGDRQIATAPHRNVSIQPRTSAEVA